MTKENKKPLLPKSSLIIRLVAGMYLIYLAYELFMGLDGSGGAPIGVSVAAAVLFGICGLSFVFLSGKAFISGNFQGGIMDISKPQDVSKEE